MAAEAVKAGGRIGPYELLAPIGAGGMGEVWKARDTRLDRVVAIKFSHAQFTERFEREARAIAALNHPNIAQIYDVGENYIVMEYVDGEPVRAPDNTRKLLDLAVQIADGLASAHAAGFVHRDLKPDNILITKAGRAKILDFGLAKAAVRPASEDATRTSVTNPGTIVGTTAYMSPEQARGEELDARSDQFSFGLVLYELVAGKRAFQRPSVPETMAAIIRDDAEPLPSSVPGPLCWVIERCLSKDPSERYDTTRGLYLELRTLRERMRDTSASQHASTVEPARRTRAGNIFIWFAAGALLATTAFVAWQLRAPWQPDTSQYKIVPFANEEAPEESPSWSPDGRSIAYTRQSRDGFEVVVRDLDGSPPVVVANALLPVESLSWSSDGSRIYYTSYGGVFSVGRAGGEAFRLPKIRRSYSSAVSPDGKSLAALETDSPGAPGKRRLVIASPPEAEPKPVSGFDPECCFAPDHLTWSPDSKRLLVSIPTAHGQEVWLVNAAGGSRRLLESLGSSFLDVAWLSDGRHGVLSAGDDPGLRLIDTDTGRLSWLLPSSTATQPSVSRDGSRIAYVEGARRFSLLEMPIDGSPPRPMVRSRLTLQYPSWAPRTNRFLYVRQEEIVLHDRDSGTERIVVSRKSLPDQTGVFEFIDPVFSPDETRVAFSVRRASGQGIWVVAVSGGTPTPIGENGGDHATPSWSPDGKWIAYSLLSGRVRKIRPGSHEQPVDLGADRCRPEWSPKDDLILCIVNPPIRPPWLMSGDGKKVMDLPAELGRPATWNRDGTAIYGRSLVGMYRGTASQQILELNWKSGSVKTVSNLPGALRFNSRAGAGRRFSISPDGKFLAGTVAASEGDIWILEGFRPPPANLWERLWPRKQ
ncbi:MAG: protein kinase [Bryobacteraceae bacterium]|nr:protein kinase [Bryobacteraceae bacterium]